MHVALLWAIICHNGVFCTCIGRDPHQEEGLRLLLEQAPGIPLHLPDQPRHRAEMQRSSSAEESMQGRPTNLSAML